MKIEPGDLCVTCNPNPALPHSVRNSGRLVIAHTYLGVDSHVGQDVWECECLGEPLIDKRGNAYPWPKISVRNLRPLRDKPGDDETLTWKETPKQLERT